jgi:hypothetical protein
MRCNISSVCDFISVYANRFLSSWERTKSVATNLGLAMGRQARNGFVGDSNPEDSFCFQVEHRSHFALKLEGLNADADVELFDSTGKELAYSINYGADPESIECTLEAGTYFVRVYQFSGNTCYQLTLRSVPIRWHALRFFRDPSFPCVDDSLPILDVVNAAVNLQDVGPIVGAQSRSGFVGNSNREDNFCFRVEHRSHFALRLEGLSADADVQLFDSTGKVLAYSINGWANSESIECTLETGTYFVRVYQFSGNTCYQLALRTFPIGKHGFRFFRDSSFPYIDSLPILVNAAVNLQDVGPIVGAQSRSGFVGNSNREDNFCFRVEHRSHFALRLEGLSADADVQLFDSTGKVLAYSNNGRAIAESIECTLEAGTYFVRVYQFSGNTCYQLTLRSVPMLDAVGRRTSLCFGRFLNLYPDPVDVVNAAVNLKDLGPIVGAQSRGGFVGDLNREDNFCFRVEHRGHFSLMLESMSADIDVHLFDSTGKVLVYSINGQANRANRANRESIECTLEAGTYFVRLYQFCGDTSYRLTLRTVPARPQVLFGGLARNLQDVGAAIPSSAVRIVAFSTTGRGKGVSCIIQDMLRSSESAIVIDAEGELVRATGIQRERLGNDIVLLDPFGITGICSDAYNPLNWIEKEPRCAVDDCYALADSLVIRTGKEHDLHWNEYAMEECAGLAARTVYYRTQEERSLPDETSKNPFDFILTRMGERTGSYEGKEKNSILSTVLSTVARHLRFLKAYFGVNDLLTARHVRDTIGSQRALLRSGGFSWGRSDSYSETHLAGSRTFGGYRRALAYSIKYGADASYKLTLRSVPMLEDGWESTKRANILAGSHNGSFWCPSPICKSFGLDPVCSSDLVSAPIRSVRQYLSTCHLDSTCPDICRVLDYHAIVLGISRTSSFKKMSQSAIVYHLGC